MKPATQNLTLAAIFAGLYAALTILLAPWSYGPIQVRVAEALTVLPYMFPQAIPGLWIGCMLANIVGGYGPLDIFGGSALTLIAAWMTWRLRRTGKPWLAPMPPVLINALGVGYILHIMIEVPYWITVLQVGIGQAIACFGLGLPLLYALKKRGLGR